ncbi:nitroreductase family protein [Amycolatopsis sp. NPDC059657]|uniref:nitroreductase family protein n=1 Tax=Amycolatopsis sp. NPDC059657 TaxID=3346899 RepID=UPI0036712455
MSSPLDLVTQMLSELASDRPPAGGGIAVRTRTEPAPLGPAVIVGEEPRQARSSLLDALHRRTSQRFFGPEPIGSAHIADLVDRGLDADRAAWPDAQEAGALEISVVAFRVNGLEPGIYRLDSQVRAYTPVAPLPADEARYDLTLQAEFCDSAAIVSLAADVDRVATSSGAHGYRMLMSRTSAAAYTMWLDAVATGLAGTVFAGFIPASVRQPLHSDGSSRHQLFALALGEPVVPPESPEVADHRE